MSLGDIIVNPYVLFYILVLGGTLGVIRYLRDKESKQIRDTREKQGLTTDILMGPKTRLDRSRQRSLIESSVFLFIAVVFPFLFMFIKNSGAKSGIAAIFVALLIWVLVSGTDLAKSFIGGLAFKILNPLNPSFQINDRVTIKGYSGKVVDIGVFHVRIQTLDDDQVSIPTMSLWNEVLISANAGARSSLCVMAFYLMPDTNRIKRKQTEDIIWDAIQSSVYFEPGKQLQIYCSQNPDAIVLQAKAYVASTYKEADFKSEVFNTVLDELNANRIHLAGAYHNIHSVIPSNGSDAEKPM